jgi:hypothetical protein
MDRALAHMTQLRHTENKADTANLVRFNPHALSCVEETFCTFVAIGRVERLFLFGGQNPSQQL